MRFTKAFAIAVLAASANGFEYLKDYSKGFRIGAATNTIHYNNRNYNEAMKAFNYMVAENACKFVSIQGTKGKYNFSDCDNHLKKAKELGMDFRGHALIWHSMAPKWLENENSQQMRQSIVDHITTVLRHYEGKIDSWDVVNEAIDDSSNGKGWNFRKSFLYNKVPDFIDLAFKTARQVSPKTKLFYNDYNTEGVWGKSDSVYQFVADLKKRNIPIDGVGLQYHVSNQYHPSYSRINGLIKQYCDLGLEVHITELDVSCENTCSSGNSENQQSEIYTTALKACLANKCCTAFLVWGIGDNDSWRHAENRPLLFNTNYQPKGPYNALLNVFKTTTAACLDGKGGNTPVTPEPTVDVEEIKKKAVKLRDGWYNIKNTGSDKYLSATSAKKVANVVVSATAQKWKVTNTDDGYITLTSSLGDFMLDIANGEDKNGANIQIYESIGHDAQKFLVLKTSKDNVYTIVTKASNLQRAIDVEANGTKEGSNVLQWTNSEKANQTWVFELVEEEKKEDDNKEEDNKCWAAALGYPCCKECGAVVDEDADGKWGIENDEWCGLSKDCFKDSTCKGVNGYPCCQKTCEVYETDSDGQWGLENDDWCLIDKSKC